MPTSVHSIRETCWVLGVSRSVVFRAIRLGILTARRQRGRLVVTGRSIRRVLSEPEVFRD